MSFALLQLRRGNGSTQVGGCVLEGSRCARLVQAGLSRLDYVRMEWIYYGFCRRCFVTRARGVDTNKCKSEQARRAPPEAGASLHAALF